MHTVADYLYARRWFSHSPCTLPNSDTVYGLLFSQQPGLLGPERYKRKKIGYANTGSVLLAPESRVNAPSAVETLPFPSFLPSASRRLICCHQILHATIRGPGLRKNTTAATNTQTRANTLCGMSRELCCLISNLTIS